MNIKELAEQSGFNYMQSLESWLSSDYEIERFAELIRQDEREQISHTYLKLTLEAVLREREACAKLCDDWLVGRDDICEVAKAIRKRGEK